VPHLILPPSCRVPDREITPPEVFRDRRRFLKEMAAAGLITLAGPRLMAQALSRSVSPEAQSAALSLYPAPRNGQYAVDAPLTEQSVAAAYNNFYEFSTAKERVARLSADWQTRPWQVRVDGLVENPVVLSIEDVERLAPLEERVYRFRCVEAWAMVVPWTGYPLRRLLEHVRPTSEARYVRFVSRLDPEEMPGVHELRHYAWPYHEALTMEEAMNDLALLVTGIYGEPLPPQHGAPVRLIVPWKYGYKSPKSLARIELTAERPPTFWNEAVPSEYSWTSNVEPDVPHPRWSQATERRIGTGERVTTLPLNGYADQVGQLYT